MNILYHPAQLPPPPAASGMGLLYNFPAIEDINNVAPTGYRVATLADMVDLIEYLGTDAGGPMKALTQWEAPNTGATNASGLTALPAGTRSALGTFADILFKTTIWIDNR